MFDAALVKKDCIEWIRKFFEENGPGCNAVVGISGGKDSSIVAALCVEALGKERVIGVLMPNGVQATLTNIPPRIRMTTLYAVAQSHNGRVANTCNLSEDWVGYSTRYGDQAGDFSPCSFLTVDEMKQIGRLCGLPDVLIDKVPIDGLCGKTDEDNLGFTYAVLDRYIRTGEIDDENIKKNIDDRHRRNLFKLSYMPCFHTEKYFE